MNRTGSTLRFFLDVREEAVHELYMRPSVTPTGEILDFAPACTCETFETEGECRHVNYVIIESENEAPEPDMYLVPIVEDAPADEKEKVFGLPPDSEEGRRARRRFLSRWVR